MRPITPARTLDVTFSMCIRLLRGRESMAFRTKIGSASGFTILELLVVQAIIGTLLSLAAPRYFRSIEKAKESVLRENLTVIRSTLDRYHADMGVYPQSLEDLVA